MCKKQVVYFHNPEYERRPQERKQVEAVSRGLLQQEAAPQIQLISSIMQIHPEILIEQEDTDMLVHASKKTKSWTWLFMGRTVYLCSPSTHDDEPSSRVIYYHPNVAMLLKHYLSKTNQ